MDNNSSLNIMPTGYTPKSSSKMKYIKIGAIAAASLLLLISLVITAWSYSQYEDLKNNFDQKLAVSSAAAEDKIKAEYEQKYQESLKSPNLTFNGPADYGSVTFLYPKTWSVYVAKDITAENYNGDYEVYFHPNAVPAITETQQYALELTISAQSYDNVVASYEPLVKNKDLKSTPITVNGVEGTRLEGKISESITGVIILVKIRDKTLIMQTDSKDFVADFDKVVASVTFVR